MCVFFNMSCTSLVLLMELKQGANIHYTHHRNHAEGNQTDDDSSDKEILKQFLISRSSSICALCNILRVVI